MMEPVIRVRDAGADPNIGTVRFSLPKAFWNLGVITVALIFAPLTYSHSALLLFIFSTYLSLMIGHSVGMHRMMIHRSFATPKAVERILVYVGVLVGMAGSFTIIKIHDIRDWAQRRQNCHPFFSHCRSFWRDLWWQLTSNFEFQYPPRIDIEENFYRDPFYRFLERTWQWHQLPIAMILYYFGGWPFVVWGVFLRVAISIVGHWTITYFCHNPGPGKWKVKGAGVQASNIPGLGLVTYGECWHNNHHAFPESARIGLEAGQSDPSWRFIQLLKFFGCAYGIGSPRPESSRDDLYKVENQDG